MFFEKNQQCALETSGIYLINFICVLKGITVLGDGRK